MVEEVEGNTSDGSDRLSLSDPSDPMPPSGLPSSAKIRLSVATGGRCDGKGFGMKPCPEAQVESGIEQLARKGGASAEAMDCPHRGGMQTAVEVKEEVKRPHGVEGEGSAMRLGHAHHSLKNTNLRLHRGTTQSVQSTLTHLHHLTVAQQGMQAVEVAFEVEIRISRPPRMDACGILPLGMGHKAFGVEHHLLRQAEDATSRRELEVVGVKVEIVLRVKRQRLGEMLLFRKVATPLPCSTLRARDHSRVLPKDGNGGCDGRPSIVP